MRETALMNGDKSHEQSSSAVGMLGCGYWESFYGEEPCGAEATHVLFYLDDPALVCAQHAQESLDDIEVSVFPIRRVLVVRDKPELVVSVGDFVRADGTYSWVLAHRKDDGRWECWTELMS